MSTPRPSRPPALAGDRADHWEQVHASRSDRETSWFQEEPHPSLDLIRSCTPRGGRVVDVGGGSSALAGRLAELGFDVTVLDVSATALERARERIGSVADRVHWIVGDAARLSELGRFDTWHDRAAFHFLTDGEERRRYVALVEASLSPAGHVVVGAFGLHGPERCSGLPVERYDERTLLETFGPSFSLVHSSNHIHTTPQGKPQEFLFAVLRRSTGGGSAR